MTNLLLMLFGGAGPGPDGPPTNVEQTLMETGKITVTWTAGDAAAATYIYRKVGGVWTFLRQEVAGAVTAETGLSTGIFGAAHIKNGQLTAIVSAA
jgi:hypothetical protein